MTRFGETDYYPALILTDFTCATDKTCLLKPLKQVPECTRVQLQALAQPGHRDTVLSPPDLKRQRMRKGLPLPFHVRLLKPVFCQRSGVKRKAADTAHGIDSW